MSAVAERVNFPFGQALPAAAALWRIAQALLNEIEPQRQQAAGTAMEQFRGRYADEFVQRMKNSAGTAQHVATDLEQAATSIAEAWADASHQQQLYAYYAMVRQKRDQQSIIDKIGNWLDGDTTNYGDPPGAPAVPAPPEFAATAVPQAYVPGMSYTIG